MNALSPAPWTILEDRIVDADGKVVAQVADGDQVIWGADLEDKGAKANAGVLVAAPSLLGALERLLEVIDVPDANCSCHLAAPCGDCVEFGGLREAVSEARAVVVKAGGAA